MKQISPALLSFLQSGASFFKADLLTLDLANGQHIYAVMGAGADLSFSGKTFSAGAFGVWNRGPIKSAASFNLESNAMKLSVVAGTSILFPGTSAQLMSVVNTGIFDGTVVHVVTAYMPVGNWGNIIGTINLFENAGLSGGGAIVAAERLGRSKAEFEVRDWNYLLNLKVPVRVISPSCFQTLFDAGCALSAATYAIARAAASGSTQTSIIPSTAWPTTDPNGNNPQGNGLDGLPYFNQGKVQFTSGQNKNLWGYIVSQAGGATGALTLMQAMPFPVATGDTFNAYPGCSKSLTTCTKKFTNQIHFTGMEWVPPPETSL